MAVKSKIFGWWYDTCATVHVSYDKSFFKTHKEANDGKEVQMGNPRCLELEMWILCSLLERELL